MKIKRINGKKLKVMMKIQMNQEDIQYQKKERKKKKKKIIIPEKKN